MVIEIHRKGYYFKIYENISYLIKENNIYEWNSLFNLIRLASKEGQKRLLCFPIFFFLKRIKYKKLQKQYFKLDYKIY